MKNVVIVGFPGAGKTTVGKSLASSLHLEFIDLDEAIEAKYHITIPHLFQKYGEFVFRQCEYQTLQEQLQKEQVLISTGGGTPCYQNTIDTLPVLLPEPSEYRKCPTFPHRALFVF